MPSPDPSTPRRERMNVPRASDFNATECAIGHALFGFPYRDAVAIAAGHAALVGAPLSGAQQADLLVSVQDYFLHLWVTQ